MRLQAISVVVLLCLAACDAHDHATHHQSPVELIAHELMRGDSAVEIARSEAMALYHAEDYAGFVARMEQVVADSNEDVDHYNLACGYALAGQRDEALDRIALLVDRGSLWDFADDSDFDSLKTDPRFHELLARTAKLELADEKLEPAREMAMEKYHAGSYAEFVVMMEKVAKYSPSDVDRYNLACGYALNGQNDEAIALLDQLADQGVDYGAASDADFATLHTDPRFQAVLAKLHAL